MGFFRKRKWQDWVFALGEVVFLVGLLPSVLGPEKPAAITSIATGLMLLGFLTVHASYKLWMAFSLCALTASLWFVLAGQVLLS